MTESQEWRKTADTHKMRPEDIKAAGLDSSKRPPAQNPGEVLHQRRKLPYKLSNMAIAGLLITGAIGYFVLYVKKKPEASARDVAKAATGRISDSDNKPLNK